MEEATDTHKREIVQYERLKRELQEAKLSLSMDTKDMKPKEKQLYVDHSDDESEDLFGFSAAIRNGPGPVPVLKIPKISVRFISKELMTGKPDSGSAAANK